MSNLIELFYYIIIIMVEGDQYVIVFLMLICDKWDKNIFGKLYIILVFFIFGIMGINFKKIGSDVIIWCLLDMDVCGMVNVIGQLFEYFFKSME